MPVSAKLSGFHDPVNPNENTCIARDESTPVARLPCTPARSPTLNRLNAPLTPSANVLPIIVGAPKLEKLTADRVNRLPVSATVDPPREFRRSTFESVTRDASTLRLAPWVASLPGMEIWA